MIKKVILKISIIILSAVVMAAVIAGGMFLPLPESLDGLSLAVHMF